MWAEVMCVLHNVTGNSGAQPKNFDTGRFKVTIAVKLQCALEDLPLSRRPFTRHSSQAQRFWPAGNSGEKMPR